MSNLKFINFPSLFMKYQCLTNINRTAALTRQKNLTENLDQDSGTLNRTEYQHNLLTVSGCRLLVIRGPLNRQRPRLGIG